MAVEPHRLTRREARRVAVRAQRLEAERPGDLLGLVRDLTLLQVDVVRAVAPSQHLVAWSRLGPAYDPGEPDRLQAEGRLVELRSMLRPAEDIALHRAEMAQWPGAGELKPWQRELAEWVEVNTECRLDLLARLREDGPALARDLPDSCVRPWRSTGWTNDKNVQRMLDLMVQRGEVAVVGRTPAGSLFDLAERVYPDDPVPEPGEALREIARRRLRALGLARERSAAVPGEPQHVGQVGEPAVVEGVRGRWRVDPEHLDAVRSRPFRGRAALLSPLDRLVFDRKRMDELFEFDYTLEMYKPREQRIWGYYALPILYGDRLVGKLDATADREAGVLHVDALHEDEPFSSTRREAVLREVRSLARWLDLEPLLPG